MSIDQSVVRPTVDDLWARAEPLLTSIAAGAAKREAERIMPFDEVRALARAAMLQTDERYARDFRQRRQRRQADRAPWVGLGVPRPAKADFQARAQRVDPAAPALHVSRIGREIRAAARDRRQRGFQRNRQAWDRALQVEIAERIALPDDAIDTGNPREQPFHLAIEVVAVDVVCRRQRERGGRHHIARLDGDVRRGVLHEVS